MYNPAGIKESKQFEEYKKYFSTVEINNSFYRLPAPETFAAWKKSTPENFVFAVKASRFITHMKKLDLDREGMITTRKVLLLSMPLHCRN